MIFNLTTPDLPFLDPQAAFKQYQLGCKIIDVRTLGEWQKGHIPNAMHIELQELAQHIPRLDKEQLIGLICNSGYRSSIATSLLQKQGFKNVFNIQHGMQGWIAEQLPITK